MKNCITKNVQKLAENLKKNLFKNLVDLSLYIKCTFSVHLVYIWCTFSVHLVYNQGGSVSGPVKKCRLLDHINWTYNVHSVYISCDEFAPKKCEKRPASVKKIAIKCSEFKAHSVWWAHFPMAIYVHFVGQIVTWDNT